MGEVGTIDLFQEAVGRAGQFHRFELSIASPSPRPWIGFRRTLGLDSQTLQTHDDVRFDPTALPLFGAAWIERQFPSPRLVSRSKER